MPAPSAPNARIRAARERLGLTTREAAARVGTSFSAWGQVERGGRPVSLEKLHNWALALGLDPHDLDPRLASTRRRPGTPKPGAG